MDCELCVVLISNLKIFSASTVFLNLFGSFFLLDCFCSNDVLNDVVKKTHRSPDNLAEKDVVEWPLVVVALGFMFMY